MILHSESDNRGGGRVNTSYGRDFEPLPQFTQTRTSNDHWVNVTTTRTDPDGSTSQSFQIIAKR
jgi:hypothetical protein